MKKVILLTSLCMLWTMTAFNSTHAELNPKKVHAPDICEYPKQPPAYLELKNKMQEGFYRNLPRSFSCPKDTTVKFFLTANGVIRDVRIENSSGNEDVDKICLDAAYCASPLPNPPLLRDIPPPPPVGAMLPPDFFGSGIYRFTFSKSEQKASAAPKYQFDLIPFEILYRYPDLFKLEELDSPENKIQVSINSEILDSLRFQWGQFYDRNKQPSKQQVQQWASEVADFYLKNGGIAARP